MSDGQIKTGYKRTEVGVIPEDWKTAQIEELAERVTVGFVGSMSHLFEKQGVPLLRGQNILPNSLDLTDTKYISASTHSLWKKSALSPGDVVVVRVGYPGTSCVIPTDLQEANAASLVVITPRKKHLNSNYLVYILNSEFGRRQIESQLVGGAQQVINTKAAADFSLPLPKLEEQKAIAEVLANVDIFLTKLDQLIAKKRDLKQATMQQLLTGKTRLPGFSGEWEVKRLGDMAILKNGYTFKSETYTESGKYKIVTIANVQDGWMRVDGCSLISELPSDLQPHQHLRVGDMLLSMTGNVGRVCRVAEPNCLLNQRVGKVIPLNIDSDFFYVTLSSQNFQKTMIDVAKGGAQPNLSSSDILEYAILTPKDKKEQKAVAAVLCDMDTELATLEALRDKTLVLKQGMMQELLTGKIRLI